MATFWNGATMPAKVSDGASVPSRASAVFTAGGAGFAAGARPLQAANENAIATAIKAREMGVMAGPF
jgi:hypothetical protein